MPASKSSLTSTTSPSRGEVTRTKLLEVAHQLFLKNGFHGTSMRNIADEAGVAVGGIYNHFADKEEIFAAVLDAYHPYHTLLPALKNTEGETVEEFVRGASDLVRVEVPYIQSQLLPLMFMEIVEFQGRHMKQLAAKIFPAALGFIEQLSRKRGQLRGLPAPVILRAYLSMMIGFILTEFMLKDSPILKNSQPDWFGGLVDIYLHGILEAEA